MSETSWKKWHLNWTLKVQRGNSMSKTSKGRKCFVCIRGTGTDVKVTTSRVCMGPRAENNTNNKTLENKIGWHQKHGQIRHPWLISPSATIIFQPSTEKTIFVTTEGYSSICQEAWEKSWQPVHQVISIWMFDLTVNFDVAHELALIYLGHSSRTPGEHCLRQSPMD